MQAMILAAGFGTRLKPYSLAKPKPLFPILNRPLLRATINRLQSYGFHQITVNCHHLRDQVIDEIETIDGVIIQDEEIILGTGGGLRQALDLLSDEPLLVTNGDIYHGVDFGEVYRHHLKTGAQVTMVLHDYPRFNTVSVSGSCVTGFQRARQENCLAYTGVQVINPKLLAEIKSGVYSCIIDHYRDMLLSGRVVNSVIADDIYWSDMGTSHDYLALHEALLLGTMPIWPELGVRRPENGLLVEDGCRVGQGFSFDGWGCIGEADLGEYVHLSRSVVWASGRVPSHALIKDSIVPPEGAGS